MAEYRRRHNSDTWHFCRNCSNWPTADYAVSKKKPTWGELDDQCRAKSRRGECR